MPKLTFQGFSYVDQYNVSSGRNLVTAIRERFDTAPRYSKNTNRPAVGGSDTPSSLGHAYHNATFVRLGGNCVDSTNTYTTLRGLPKTAKIKRAILYWGIFKADSGNTAACTWHFKACKTSITNSLTGKNQPQLDDSVDITYSRDKGTDVNQDFQLDITTLVQKMVEKGYDSFKIYTTKGKNRRYLKDPISTLPKFEIEYDAKPTILTGNFTTDCIGDKISEKNLTFNVTNSNGTYFRYSASNSSRTIRSEWITSKSYTMNISKFTDGTSFNVTIESAYMKSPDTSCINSIVLGNCFKNQNSKITHTVTGSQLYYDSNRDKYICTGSVTFKGALDSYYGVKKNFTATTSIVMGSIFSHTINNGGLNIQKSHSFVAQSTDVSHSVVIKVNTGHRTVTKQISVISAQFPTITILEKRSTLPNNYMYVPKVVVTQSEYLENVTPTLSANLIWVSLADIEEVSSLPVSIVLNQPTFSIPAIYSERSNNNTTITVGFPFLKNINTSIKPFIEISGHFINSIGQVAQTSILRFINCSPCYESVYSTYGYLARDFSDIFNTKTYEEDLALGYSRLILPIMESEGHSISPGININTNQIYDSPLEMDNDFKNIGEFTYQSSTTTERSFEFSGKSFRLTDSEFLKPGNGTIIIKPTDIYNTNDVTTISGDFQVVGNISSPQSMVLQSYMLDADGVNYDYTNNGTPYSIYESSPNNGIMSCGSFIRLLVPPPSSPIPGTLNNHLRIQVQVKQKNTPMYELNSQVGDTVQYNGNSYYELFFPLSLPRVADHYVTFYVAYLDRFNRKSPYFTDGIRYEPYQEPKVDMYGTVGGGFRWIFKNPDVGNITSPGYLYNPLFYAKIQNYNSTSFRVEMSVYDSNKNKLGSEPRMTLPSITSGSPNITYCGRYFNGVGSFTFSPSFDTLYYIGISIYSGSNLIYQTPFTQDYTFMISDKYRKNSDSVKYWTVDDFLSGELLQAEQISILNDYIRRIYKSYRMTHEPLLVDPWISELITASSNSTEYINTVTITKPVFGIDSWRYHPELTSPNQLNVNRCGPERSAVTYNNNGHIRTYESRFIPWGIQKQLEVLIPLYIGSSAAISKMVSIGVDFYDNSLTIIPEGSFDLQIQIPSTLQNGTSLYAEDELYIGNILDCENSEALFKRASYIKIRCVTPNTKTTSYCDIISTPYVAAVNAYRNPVSYVGQVFEVSKTFNALPDGTISKQDYISSLKESIILLRDKIYSDCGSTYVSNSIATNTPSYTPNTKILSKKISGSSQLGDLDIIAIDNKTSNGGLFNIFKSW